MKYQNIAQAVVIFKDPHVALETFIVVWMFGDFNLIPQFLIGGDLGLFPTGMWRRAHYCVAPTFLGNFQPSIFRVESFADCCSAVSHPWRSMYFISLKLYDGFFKKFVTVWCMAFNFYSWQLYICVLYCYIAKGSQIPAARSPWRLNSPHWRLMLWVLSRERSSCFPFGA